MACGCTKLFVVVLLSVSLTNVVQGFVQQGTPRRSDYAESSMTPTQKQDMLDAHNKFRSIVTPPAANMEYQVWSDDLASLAQMWTDKCTWAHGFLSFGTEYPKEPTIALRDESIGQNLAREYGKITSPEQRVERWYNEIKYYTFNKFDSPMGPDQCVPGRICGHYTQLAWALSRNVGCGMTWCNKNFDRGYHPPSNPGETIVNCDYAPTGNFIGEYPYKLGTPCSKCSSGYGWCYKNLCRDCKDHSLQCGKTLTKDMCTVDVEKMTKFCPKMCNLCECPLQCKRGTLDKSRCICKCPTGYRPPDCSEKCEDMSKFQCKDFLNKGRRCDQSYMQDKCPASCGICVDASGTPPLKPTTAPAPVSPEVETPVPIPAPVPVPGPSPGPGPGPAPEPPAPVPAPSPSESSCTDQNGQCPLWASEMECEKNKEWMLKNCKTSCNQCKACQDLFESCPEKALQGECGMKPDKMLVNCRRSCGLCKVYDKESECPAWSAQGKCSSNWSWMLNNCPQSCDVSLSGYQFCSNKPDGQYPTPISCRGYIECITGWTKYQSCQEGKSFDNESKTCRPSEQVVCKKFPEYK